MQQTDIGQHLVNMQSVQCLRSGAHLDPSGAALGLLVLPGRLLDRRCFRVSFI
jgi:hypothetical protein